MNLLEIGRMAADEAERQEVAPYRSGEVVDRVENGDGTVSFSVAFDLDPEYAAEMARAMPKGEQREDQVDASVAEDETPADARHSETPIENCRAKDPMFCPYHGTQVMTQKLQEMFKQHGIDGNVSVEGKGYHFTARFTVPAQDEQSALADIYNGFLNRKGIVAVRKGAKGDDATENDGYESSYEAEVKVDEGSRLEPRRLMSEWVDNIIDKLADDPDLKKQVSRNDFVDMLGAVAEMHKAADVAEKDTTGDPNLAAAAQAAYDKAADAIDVVTAMMDYKDVGDIGAAKTLSDGYDKTVADAKATYAPLDQQVRAKKVALFGARGAYPTGFAKDHPWAAEKLSAKLSDFSHTGKTLTEAESGMRAAYGALANAGKKPGDALTYAERKGLRVALQKMAEASEMVEGHAAKNAERSKAVLAKLDEMIAAGGYQKPGKAATGKNVGKKTASGQQQGVGAAGGTTASGRQQGGAAGGTTASGRQQGGAAGGTASGRQQGGAA